MPEFYNDIFAYLDSLDNNKSVSAKGLDEYIYYVCAHTALEHKQAAFIVKYLFHEIRSAMLRGEVVSISDFGKFYISSPKVSGNKKFINPIFKPYKSIKNYGKRKV